jgi:indolepyruvate ferredoxin oxidoreductase beta subunit
MIREYNVLISSVGGQGGITLARILSNAGMNLGLKVLVGETLGMAQRGGSVQSHVRFGEDVYGPLIPEGRTHVLLSLEPAEALRVAKYIGKKTTIILNTSPTLPLSVMLNEATYPNPDLITSILEKLGDRVYPINATELAKKAGSSRSLNIVIMGAYMSLGEPVLTLEAVREAIATSLPSRYLEQNNRALKIGLEKMRELTLRA